MKNKNERKLNPFYQIRRIPASLKSGISLLLYFQIFSFLLISYEMNASAANASNIDRKNVHKKKSELVCSLSISKISIGECTYNETTGLSRTLVAVFLDWNEAPAGQNIVVTYKGQTKTLNPATPGIPNFVQFIVPADGSSSPVTAGFSGGGCTASPMTATIPEACAPQPCGAAGTLGGRVFYDFNNNGTQQASEYGIKNVGVKIYNDFNQLLCQTTTGINGLWRCNGLPVNAKVRVEFNPPASFKTSKPGGNNASDIQFATVGSCSVNYGIYETKNFMDADPWMVIPCYTKGDPNVPGSPVAQEPTIVANKYMTPSGSRESNNYYVSNASETGTVWGLCYQPETKSLLSSAFLRRHTQWGPGGLGAIYKTDMTAFLNDPNAAPNKRLFNQTTTFLNLDDFGVNTGDEVSLARDIVANPSTPTRDILAFQNIGKMGLGDMDLNDKRDSLFIVNLFNKSIVTIKIGNPILASIPAGNVSEIPIPDPGCTAEGDWRPFGLKYKDGIIYVGGVCSGESTQNASDMRAIVYAYSNGTFTEIVNIKLDYVKGKLQGSRGNGCYDFIPWTNDWSKLNYGGTGVCGPSPMLTDIEFDGYGNLILGVGDRAGYQVGFEDYGPFPTGNTTYNGFAGGDILKLYNNNGTFLMENNGTSGYFTSAGANAGEGINGGEFYYQDGLVVCCHNETVLGGLAVHPSDDAVITTVIDAVNIFANGWKMLSNTTGAQTRVYDIFVSSGGDITFNKAAGLGDLELLQSSSATGGLNLQVGNYIWQDSDLDGIQDPSENPVPNIPVSLYKKVNGTLTFITSTTTNASGQYFFNDLLPDMDYVIAVGNPQNYSLDGYFEANGIFYLSTTANAAGSNDQNDSDATPGDASLGILKGVNTICFKTGALGENNYTLDIGLVPPGIGNFVWKDDNFNGRQDAGEEGVQGAVLKLHACANGIPGAVVPGYTKTTNSIGYYNFQNVPQGTYAISYDFSGLANSNNMYFSIPNIEGNTVDNLDSDPKYVLPGNKVEFGACFNWDGNPAGLDYSHDAGIVCDKDKDGIPDDFDDNDLLIDPTGYLYCEHTGEILDGGSISISGPGNVYMIYDGSSGYYQYFVDATGIYTMTVNDPPGFVRSIKCPDLGFLDAPDSLQIFNPYSVGSGNDNGDDFLDDYTCSVNRLYITMLLEPGDYITNNNIPYQCSDLGDLPAPYPTLLTADGPLHGVMQTPSLYMGALVDKEFDGSPEACAGDETGGDDKDKAVDDEDGIANMPLFIISQTSVVTVNVTNRSGVAAKLIGFMDLNGDGDFNDSGEMSMASVPNGTNNGTRNLSFTVPLDAPAGQKVGLRLRLSTDTEIEPTGAVRFGEIEDYMVQIVGFDFGDLPDSYNTSGDDFPPKHLVTESLKLGSSVDAELDGSPDPMAGSMGAGDDGDPGLVTFGTSTPAGDDENGLMLASPMIPGYAATFMVTAMNMTTANAVLQAWVDFNGNGSFESNEQLTTGSFAPNGANIPVGGLNGAKLNFNVPASATFYQGNAMVRFRLSSEGNLAPNSQIGFLPFGEIEDYKFPLGKVGNIVFEDRDFDGTQDSGEPGIDGVSVAMVWGGPDGNVATTGDNLTYTTTTGPSSGQQTGEYYFCGLIDGTYKMIFTTPSNMTPTRSNIGTQTNGSTADSDGSITGMDLTMAMESFTIASVTALPTGENGLGDAAPSNVGTFPDAQNDETHDQGFAFQDYGDLPESGNGDNFNTTMAEGGAVHVIIPGLKLGASVDGERDGSGNATASGDDNSNTGSTDDEDGVNFVTPLIPGYSATIAVTAMNMTGSNAMLQGWIDWNNNGLLDANEALAFTNNGVVPNGGVTNAPYTFPVPASAIFNDGMVFARFRLSPNGGQSADGPDKYNATTIVPQGEVEDYKLDVAKVGNYVWEDRNFNGLQDSGEPAINGVAVAMIWGGPDGNVATTGDNLTYTTTTGPASGQQAGEYYFCGLIPGTYKLVFTSPDNMTPTRSNIGSQVNGSAGDSDGLVTGMDMSMAMETFTIACAPCQPLGENGTGDNGTAPTGTFPDLHTDETHDQGFAYLDYGDLPESGNGDNFNTTMGETGAVHVIIPGLKLGASVDGERNGFPVTTADGDDNSNTGSADDEDGVNFVTPLIPGYSATIAVTAMNMTGSNAVLQGWIDWNNNGQLDGGEALAFTNNGVVPNGTITNAPYTFPVPAGAIFNDGMVFARFRLSPNGGQSADGPDKYNASTTVPAGEVEDYKKNLVKVGNIVWEDYDFDGQQDANEPGIGNMPVALIWAGADGNLMTPADNVMYSTATLNADTGGNLKGEYNFCGLIEGTYKIAISSEPGYAPTLPNTGDQTNGGYTDSDGILVPAGAFPGIGGAMVMTDPIVITLAGITQQPTNENGKGDNSPNVLGTFPNNQTNESYDFGFVAVDYGDLPNSYVTFNGGNNIGAMHVIQPGKYLGMGVDAEMDANVDAAGTAGMWTSGDDNGVSPLLYGMVTNGDDEDGVSFVSPLVPGYKATVRIKYTAIDLPGLVRTNNTYLSGWVDFNGNGIFEAGDKVISDLPLATGTNVMRDIDIMVPLSATFTGGAARARFRIHCQPGMGSAGLAISGEVEDYYIPVAKAGNYVWFDNDLRGDEMITNQPFNFLAETGINDVDMVMVWGGLDGNLSTTADNRVYRKTTAAGTLGENQDGIYYFCGLIQGNYTVLPRKYAGVIGLGTDSLVIPQAILATPSRKILTIANNVAGNDYKDSDATPSVNFNVPDLLSSPAATLGTLNENLLGDLPTIFGFPDRLTNMGLDFGFIQEPNIELNQKIAGIERGGECGRFKVVMDLCIQNSGGSENGYKMAVPLRSIQANVPLADQLGGAFLMTMGSPRILNGAGNWECDEAAMPQQLPTVNTAFNGRSDTRLFTDNTGLLYPGEKVVVRFVFELDPYAIPAALARNLSVQASGSGKAVNYQGQPVPDFYNSGNQYMAMDLSNDGLEFNGTYNDPDGKTYIGDCWESSQQSLAANNHVYIAVSPTNCFTDVEDAMILEGEKEKCVDNAFCLEGYYRVTLKDLSGNIVPNPVPPTYIGKTIIAEVENIISCNKTWGYVTFEYKHPPVVTCQDVVVKCGDDITNLPKPLVQSCVDIVRMEFKDYPSPKGCDSDYWQTIERSWQVEDELGMTSSCIQRINVERNSLTSICNSLDNYNGTDKAPLSCTENWKKDASGNPHPDVTGYPQPNGCNVSCIYSDLVFEGCGNSKSIIRTWICSDQCSNTLAECEQRIDVKDIEGPTFVSLSTPVFGPPSIDGCVQGVRFSLPEMHDDCSDEITVSIKVGAFGGAFADGFFPAQGFAALPVGTHEVLYTAVDNCGNASSYTTTITIVDKTAPVVVTKQNIIVSLVPGGIGYQGYARLYNTSVDGGSFDACSGVKVELRRPNGAPACYNNGKRTGDGQEYNNNVTFNNEVPRLHANDSSLDTDGGEFVSFCCEDLTTGVDTDGDGVVNVGYHEVIVRVWDDADRDNVFGSAGDNYNESWAYVKVEDKLPPVITCPPNMTIFCDWAIDQNVGNGDASAKSVAGFDFSKTGLPVAYGVCGVTDIKFWDREVVDQCDLGYIDRTFLATGNGQTVKCVQRITVQQSPVQAPWTFIPSSLSTTPIATTCDGPTQADIDRNAPKYTAGPCDVIGVNTKTTQFDFEGGVCRKWTVEYTYMNWCTNEQRGPFIKNFAYEDKVAPVLTCEDKMFAVDGNCEASVTLSKVATDDSGCVSGGGWLKWEVYVDLWADGSQDLLYSSFYAGPQGVAKTITINGTAHNVRQYTLAPTTSGGEAKFTLPEPITGKMSNHKVVWKVTDGCHNWESCSETFMVTDKKAPTPVCVNLSTALMQDPDGSGPLKPMVELWAIDFMNKSYDNCTDADELLYTFDDWAPQVTLLPDGAGNPMSIDHAHFFSAQGGVASAVNPNTSVYKAGLTKYLNGEIQLWVPASRSAAKVWVADSYNADTYKEVDVHVTVWDKKFNHDFCWTSVKLLHGGSGAQPKIAGNVSTAAAQAVNNVMINVDADINEYPRAVTTKEDGNYQMEVQAANTYEITAAKTGDYLNGVSTLDLVMIQRHILGLQKLDSPYKLIAADANGDGKVTAADLTELRKLILGVNNSFTSNQSWRFPVKEQIMNAANPFPFVEKIVKDVLTADVTGLDFVAVKIGDVNGNVATNVADPLTESRSSKAVVMAITEQEVADGDEVSVPVTAADFKEIMGYQMTMKLTGAEFAGIEKGALNLDASHVGVLAGGIVTMSFASQDALTVKEGEVLFTLKLKAAKQAMLSDIIALTPGVTPAESYNADLEVGKVSLEVRATPEEVITLYQNEPNPFLGATKVSFYMPKAAEATLSIFDVTGKLVTTRNINAVKGMNTEVFTREQLQTSGVLYYTLENGDFTATKKMIIIE